MGGSGDAVYLITAITPPLHSFLFIVFFFLPNSGLETARQGIKGS